MPAVTRRSPWTRWTGAALLLVASAFLTVPAQAAPKSHVVQSGQRLGSIAKRYNVTIEDICIANGIRRTDKIFPGQKLVIPERGKAVPPKPAPASKPTSKQSSSSGTKSTKSTPAPAAKKGYGHPLVHVVVKGQTLGAIAQRYGVSIDAVCHASGIDRRSVLKIGQRLIVPATTDPDGSHARRLRIVGRLDGPTGGTSWQKYAKAPWRRGYITIQSHSQSWKGYVFGPGQKILPNARKGIFRVLGVRSGGPVIDDQLIRLLAQLSDQFGSRPIRIVSGYRETSYVHDSKHKVGRALDFSIPGIPNEALRDYCRGLGSVGVGYDPNSTFVHLSVRPSPAYWVDYAGPGEPPRLTPERPRPTVVAASTHTKRRPSTEAAGAIPEVAQETADAETPAPPKAPVIEAPPADAPSAADSPKSLPDDGSGTVDAPAVAETP